MRERLLHAPAWVLGLLNGSLFGLFWTLSSRLVEDDSWTSSLIRGGVLGVFFGAFTGVVQHRQQRGVRGPVPQEPEVRAAARDLALAHLAQYDRQRVWGPLVYGAFALLSLFLAVADSPWFWLGVVLGVVAAVGHLRTRSRLRRRADLLRPDPSAQQVPSP
jgi:hypothetical protein